MKPEVKTKIKEIEQGLKDYGASAMSTYFATEYLYKLADEGQEKWFMQKSTKELIRFFDMNFELGLQKFLNNH